MALSQVGVALACTEVALFEIGAAHALHPAPTGYKKCVQKVATSPTPVPVSGDAPHSQWGGRYFRVGRGGNQFARALDRRGPLWMARPPPEANGGALVKDGP